MATTGFVQIGATGKWLKRADGSGPYTYDGTNMVLDAGGPSGATASDGVTLPVDSLAQTLAYDGSGNLSTITVSYGGNTYIQTLTYTGSNLTGISQWVKQ